MTVTEKVAYIKGLVDGLDLDAKKDEVKVIKAIIELLDDMAMSVSDLEEGLDVVSDQVDEIDEDLSDLEGYVYEDDDDCCGDDDCYEIECPNCGETVYVSEDDLDAGEANCAHCGVTFEVALEGDGEDDAEDGPVQYEVTCPECGTTSVFEEDELLDGAPKCPNCGKPLDFEVTEE